MLDQPGLLTSRFHVDTNNLQENQLAKVLFPNL